jgi:hypothetical protein
MTNFTPVTIAGETEWTALLLDAKAVQICASIIFAALD